MSEIIESLKASAKEFYAQRKSDAPGQTQKKTPHELTQEQLADIYFSGAGKTKQSEQPLVIKVVEKPKPSAVAPWTIASIAFLIAALSLFTTKRVFIDVKIIDEARPVPTETSLPPEDKAVSPEAPVLPPEGGQTVSFDGTLFSGASRLKSSKTLSELTLVNSSVASFARAAIPLRPSADLSGKKIVFYAKGKDGGENLAFGMRDKGNRSAFPKSVTFPFPGKLGVEWQKAEILMADTLPQFDPREVTSFRFDFGTKATGNRTGDTVFVKGLEIVPL